MFATYNFGDHLVQLRLIGLVAIGLLVLCLAIIEFGKPLKRSRLVAVTLSALGDLAILGYILLNVHS
jgi:hypothetical protein